MRFDNIWNLQTSSYRRCLRVTLLCFVIQLFAVSQLKAEDKISISKLKVIPGTTQKLAILLNNQEEYTAFQAEFYFPKGITPVKDASGNCKVSLSSRATDHIISANVVKDGGLKVAAYSMNNESLTGNSGELFYIDITSEATFEGPATIEAKDILFTKTIDRKEIEFDNTKGVLNTQESLKGDANGNGAITVDDIVEIVNYIAGKPDGTFNYDAADMNDDGEVNAADIVGIVNYLTNK